jgi:hypothetical protein
MIEGKRNIRVIIATGDLLNYELSISKAQNKRGDISHFIETEKIHSSQDRIAHSVVPRDTGKEDQRAAIGLTSFHNHATLIPLAPESHRMEGLSSCSTTCFRIFVREAHVAGISISSRIHTVLMSYRYLTSVFMGM